MNEPRHQVSVASYVILRRENQVLLMKRVNTGYEDGKYGLPSGHIEPDEFPEEGARREAMEEIGVGVQDLQIVTVLYTNDNYVCFFFVTDNWQGEPKNCEEDKCDDLRWFDLDALPENIVPEVGLGLQNYRQKVYYSKLDIVKKEIEE